MKKASITDAKNSLSALIDSLKGGAPVLIVDRGVRSHGWSLSPGARRAGKAEDCLDLSATACCAHAGPARLNLFSTLRRHAPNASAVELLIDERREER